MNIYAADFETTTEENDCRVWAWGLTNIYETNKIRYGNSIESFIDYISELDGRIYFHNLKFDGRFLLDWLLRNGYDWRQKPNDEKTFGTLISEMGVFYSITIIFPMVGEASNIKLRYGIV